MNSVATDVKDMLVAESLGLVFATNLFIGTEPTEPDNCVTVFDTPGAAPQMTLEGGNDNYYYPAIQIRVRNNDYLNAWSLMNDIRDALHGRANETWNSTFYTVISCSADPSMLDRDDGNRIRLIINFNLQRR